MKTTFEGEIEQNTIYGHGYTDLIGKDSHGVYMNEDIHSFLESFVGKRIKITIETLDEDHPEDMVTVTYWELFKRARNDISFYGVSPYYLNEGGDPDAIKDITKHQALFFMSEEEFNGRCHSEVGA